MKKMVLVSVITLLTACGGGSSSDSSDSSNTGVFLDSPVINIGYRTNTFEGVTNSQGEYKYLAGETVMFFIGDLEFPEVSAAGAITPLTLTGTTDITDSRVVNIIRLLQSLDKDGNLDNGLTITDAAKSSATQVDFTLTESEFESSSAVTSLISNAGQDRVVTELVSTSNATGHFMSTIQNNPLMSEYCEVDSDRYGSIFTTHTNDCKQRKYREAYYELLLPIFYQLGQMSNNSILSEITKTQLRRDTVSQILKAKKLVKYTKLIKATSAKGASEEAVKAIVGETADLIGGSIAQSLGGMVGNEEYGNIWYGVLKSYANAPSAILGDPEAIASLVESQVDSLWKIGSDTLASWNLNNLTEQSNELQITQYSLEYYYSNFANNSKLLETLELNGSFDWGKVVDKVAQLKGYDKGVFSEDYSTSKVVQQVKNYIAIIEKVVNADSFFIDDDVIDDDEGRVNYQIDDGISNTTVVFRGQNAEIISVPTDAYIRIVPRSYADADNYSMAIVCGIQSNGDFENNCLIYSEQRVDFDNVLSNSNETYQVAVFKNHKDPAEKHWECGENLYKFVGSNEVNWSNIEVSLEDFQDRTDEICHNN